MNTEDFDKMKDDQAEDLTPTWKSLLNVYLSAYAEKRSPAALEELKRMADLADRFNFALRDLKTIIHPLLLEYIKVMYDDRKDLSELCEKVSELHHKSFDLFIQQGKALRLVEYYMDSWGFINPKIGPLED